MIGPDGDEPGGAGQHPGRRRDGYRCRPRARRAGGWKRPLVLRPAWPGAGSEQSFTILLVVAEVLTVVPEVGGGLAAGWWRPPLAEPMSTTMTRTATRTAVECRAVHSARARPHPQLPAHRTPARTTPTTRPQQQRPEP